jgi:hypothetical protein
LKKEANNKEIDKKIMERVSIPKSFLKPSKENVYKKYCRSNIYRWT